jgi:hypothetical protein
MIRAAIALALLALTAATPPRADYRTATPSEDVTKLLTSDRSITTAVRGGRAVVLDGQRHRAGRVALYGATERVEVRNVHIVPSGDDDGLDMGSAGLSPTVVIENVRITGVGTATARHPDCIQPQADIGELLISKVTCETGYQGLFIKGDATHRVSKVVIRDANFRHAPGTDPKAAGPLLWLVSDGQPRVPITLNNVWVERLPGRPITQLVWPKKGYKSPAGEDISPIIDEKAGTISWPAAARIEGVVHIGTPPGGDFAPER